MARLKRRDWQGLMAELANIKNKKIQVHKPACLARGNLPSAW